MRGLGAFTPVKRGRGGCVRNQIREHPLVAFFALAFAVTWGLDALRLLFGVGGTAGALLLQVAGAGPSLAGLLVAWAAHGGRGLKELFGRALRWRVGLRWYLLVLVAFPALLLGVLAAASVLSGGTFSPTVPVWLLPAFVPFAVLLGPLPEELGWRAFALPLLMERYGWLRAGLVLGAAWALWHRTPETWSQPPDGGLVGLILTAVVQDVALSILMAWVFLRTGGSALVAGIGMHTAANFVLFVPMAQPDPATTWAVTVAFSGCLALLALLAVLAERESETSRDGGRRGL